MIIVEIIKNETFHLLLVRLLLLLLLLVLLLVGKDVFSVEIEEAEFEDIADLRLN